MHAKEKPDAAEIKLQNELYEAYDVNTRKAIQMEIVDESEKSVPLDKGMVDRLRGSDFTQQFRNLLVRSFKNLFRNEQFTRARIMQTVVVAIVLDILFFRKTAYDTQSVRDKNSVLFFINNSQLMFTLQSVILSCNRTPT
ncbi:MAG: hypothetical protein P4M11_08550 [Candidatus Pacebacteria bacterium]|nr:hypothetical protein [Candidatus Paceibacterota bacterium]